MGNCTSNEWWKIEERYCVKLGGVQNREHERNNKWEIVRVMSGEK